MINNKLSKFVRDNMRIEQNNISRMNSLYFYSKYFMKLIKLEIISLIVSINI